MARSNRRRMIYWCLPVSLFCVGVALHLLCWDYPHRAGSVPFEGIVKRLNNAGQALAAPGWVLVWKSLGWSRGVLPTSIAIGSSVLGWTACIMVILRVRKRLVGRIAEDGVVDRGRRRFLVDGALGVAGVSTAGVGSTAVVGALGSLRTARYDVVIDDLPLWMDGLRVVQLSDLHLGPRVPAGFLDGAISTALELKPDLVCLTGDYVHAGTYQLEALERILSPVVDRKNVPLGAVGVLGNHDWYNDGPRVSRALDALGVRMIDNGRVFLDASGLHEDAPDEGLCLAGLGDLYVDTIDARAALEGVPDGLPRVVLAHNPDTAETSEVVSGWAGTPPRIDLMLSGHTHGGQVRLPRVGTPLVPSQFGAKYAGGLVDGPTTRVIVSRGIGLSILPVRWGVPPEIGLITLQRG